MHLAEDHRACDDCGTWYFGPAPLCSVCRQVFDAEGEIESTRDVHARFDEVLKGARREPKANDPQQAA